MNMDSKNIIKQLSQDGASRIISYSGLEGLKQITLNSLDTKDELCLFEIKSMNEFIPKEEAEEIRKEFVRRKIKMRELTNAIYHEEYTKIDELFKYEEIRYIDPNKFEIKTEIIMYNDVLAIYDFREEIFGVEIYNKQLVAMMKQIFDFFWNMAERPIIGKGGRTSLL